MVVLSCRPRQKHLGGATAAAGGAAQAQTSKRGLPTPVFAHREVTTSQPAQLRSRAAPSVVRSPGVGCEDTSPGSCNGSPPERLVPADTLIHRQGLGVSGGAVEGTVSSSGSSNRRAAPRTSTGLSRRQRGARRAAAMQLVSNALAQEAAMGALMVGYFMYYYEVSPGVGLGAAQGGGTHGPGGTQGAGRLQRPQERPWGRQRRGPLGRLSAPAPQAAAACRARPLRSPLCQAWILPALMRQEKMQYK
jgi:hypothetical protein